MMKENCACFFKPQRKLSMEKRQLFTTDLAKYLLIWKLSKSLKYPFSCGYNCLLWNQFPPWFCWSLMEFWEGLLWNKLQILNICSLERTSMFVLFLLHVWLPQYFCLKYGYVFGMHRVKYKHLTSINGKLGLSQ